MWTEAEAGAKFEEIIQLAQSGEAQIIGERDSCVVISLAEYERLSSLKWERPVETVRRREAEAE